MSRPREIIRLLLIDDHPIVREGVRTILGERPDFYFAGEHGSPELALSDKTSAAADVALLDFKFPSGNALQFLPAFRQRLPALRLLVFTADPGRETVLALHAAGVEGLLLKDSAPSEYIEAIHAVASGKRFFSPGVAHFLAPKRVPAEIARLSESELRYLLLVTSGKTSRQIRTSCRDPRLPSGPVGGRFSKSWASLIWLALPNLWCITASVNKINWRRRCFH